MTTQINVRVEESLKKSVEEIFNNLGITMAEAFRIFLKKVQSEGGIPFSMKCRDETDYLLSTEANRKALELAMDDVKNNRNLVEVELVNGIYRRKAKK
jgi:DNA-damage-inducible protein J